MPGSEWPRAKGHDVGVNTPRDTRSHATIDLWPRSTASALVGGYLFIAVGYVVATAAVPEELGWARLVVIALALAAYAWWARQVVCVLCFTAIAWLAATARLSDENGELVLESSLLSLVVLVVAAGGGLLLGRVVPR